MAHIFRAAWYFTTSLMIALTGIGKQRQTMVKHGRITGGYTTKGKIASAGGKQQWQKE